jgi:signal-transduction protein with cAMP-binding, CBS, and nucleotidyltransferase domain
LDSDFSNRALQGYSESLQQFRRDDVIIHEGETTDNHIYLLHKGSVGIYRSVENNEIFIDKIDAGNFFGEIEIFSGGARLGTVRALTDDVVTYRFLITDPSNVSMPDELDQLLFRRLSRDLKDYSNRYIKSEACINRLLDEKDGSLENAVLLIRAIEKVLNTISRSSSFSQSEIEIVSSLRKMMDKYISRKLPQINYRLVTNEPADFRTMYEENLIPEDLVNILLGN